MNSESSNFEPWHLRREYGLGHLPTTPSSLSSQPLSLTSRDNSSQAPTTVSFTGSWLSTSEDLSDSPQSRRSLETPVIGSQLDPQPQTTMYGRTTPPSPTPASNLVNDHLNVIAARIGIPLRMQLNQDGWTIFRATCMLEVTSLSNESLATIWSLFQSNEKFLFIGDLQVSENRDEHGNWLGWTHIQKIQGPSSGMDIEIMNMLLSTSSEEASTFLTYYDGSTGTQLSWKSKAQVYHCAQRRYLSPATWIQDYGTPTLTSLRRKLF